jgi:hypothetical protein
MKYSLERLKNPRFTENSHILFWLIKDTCWVLEFKPLGVFMIIPTILMAILIAYRSLNTSEYYVNVAVFFWISANSFWMCTEFFDYPAYKHITGYFFAMGILSFLIYVHNLLKVDTNNK